MFLNISIKKNPNCSPISVFNGVEVPKSYKRGNTVIIGYAILICNQCNTKNDWHHSLGLYERQVKIRYSTVYTKQALYINAYISCDILMGINC